MFIITHDDIANLDMPFNVMYDWVCDDIKHKNEAVLRPKISLKVGHEGFYNTMPALLPNLGCFGVKVVSRYPERFPALDSQILLYDLETGDLLALMDGNYITTMRTGLVAAHSLLLFGKAQFDTVAFIGLGNTARATLASLLAITGDRHFNIRLLRYKDQHDSFIRRFAAYQDRIDIEIYDDIDTLVHDATTIVSSLTYTDDVFCPVTAYAPGCTIIPIHTRGFQNCDPVFDKIYADDRGHVEGFQHFGDFRSFAEVADVVNGVAPGRENSSERILVYNIGIALHDISFAAHLYQQIQEHGLKHDAVTLNNLHSKFWA